MTSVPDKAGATASTESQLPNRLYAPVEVAHILNVSTQTVQKWCRDGMIEATKPVGGWRITGKEVLRFIKEGPRKANANGTTDQSG